MAKTIQLGVTVTDAEFKAFVKTFNELTEKMKEMTQQWKALGMGVNNTAVQIERATISVKSITQHLVNAANTAHKFTKTIARWGGIIGGIVTMLGGGAFFGMDRIAARMVEMRRNLLGLSGADYGKTQATLTFGKGLLDDPKAALAAIARGKSNIASDEARALAAKGFTREQIENMDPNDLLTEWLKRTAKIKMKGGRTIPTAMGQKEHTILSEQDIVRLHGDQGEELVEMFEKRAKATQGLTDEDLKTWSKFWESVTNFKNKIDTEWIKALEPLAPAGTKLIEAITNLTTSFIKWEKATGDIEKIAKGIEWLANFMENPSWKEAWNAFQYFFKQDIEDVKKILRFLHILGPGVETTPPPAGSIPPVGIPQSKIDTAKSAASGALERFRSLGLGTGGASVGGAGGPSFNFGSSSTSLYPRAMGGSVPSAGGGGVAPMPPPFSFSSAVQGMAPTSGGAVNGITNSVLDGLRGGGAASGGGGRGPLDSNNWQNNRTSSLVIRGVPSANLFLTAAGMTG